MIKQDGKGPRFRGKGAETRHLVGFGLELSQNMNDASGGTIHYRQLLSLMVNLMNFYGMFGQIRFDAKKAAEYGKNVCLLYSNFREASNNEMIWEDSFSIFWESVYWYEQPV